MSSEYAKSQYQEMISESQLSGVVYSMIVLASLFVLARSGVQVYMRRKLEAQDYLLYAAFILFLTMTICYLVILSKVFIIARVSVGFSEPGPTFQADMITYVRMMFVTTTLFWISLWLVKLSFLSFYRKLLEGLPNVYMRLWSAVLAFCVITLIGCIISYTTSCPDFGAAMSRGDCPLGPRTTRGSLASLYTAYAVDMLSDLMIMALPIQLVWNLQMARGKKIAVVALFASGIVCMAFATLRVVQIGIKSENSTAPSPTWLALWTLVENAIAICIGCCPAFAILYRSSHTPHVSYDTNGYVRHSQSRSGINGGRREAIKMSPMSIGSGRKREPKPDAYWDDTRSSQEDLATDNKTIVVTTTLQQENRHSSVAK
ncbi:hypothetical protein G6011_04913 [Alternaria panax]|uniref:Rhodopsin domain-containing protein n=1 Tax=Alternaria panax TaxID=48097 RepID=A0AAD4II33_9PLEO|nr:hypothetical protein G6011_04913 [Alternaria panax]